MSKRKLDKGQLDSDEDESLNTNIIEESDSESEIDSKSLPELQSDSSADDFDLNSDEYETASDSDVEYVTGADGKSREIRPPIDPHYSSDDSDGEEANTIGNVPISAYDKFPHIGYDIDGKRVMRPATSGAIDSLLETIDLPKGWTGLIDKNTGGSLNLSAEEMDLINRIQSGKLPNDSINPFEDQVEWFSSKTEKMPLSAAPEPKRRFVPSKHEDKKIMKIVKAIREGRIVLQDKKLHDINDDSQMMLATKLYDVWQNEQDNERLDKHYLAAPKLPPPTHDESYNPPEEYLLDDKEKEEWEKTPREDRETNYLPQKYGSLRKVPGYSESIRERLERCLDLYLAPRVEKQRLNIDPDSLIPELPSPKDLRPFPIKCSTVYKGHEGHVRCLSVHPDGNILATGGEDGSVRVWDVITGRELWRVDILRDDTYNDEDAAAHDEDKIDFIQWNPRGQTAVLAVAAGDNIYLMVPGPSVFDISAENAGLEAIEAGWAYNAKGNVAKASSNVAEDEDENDEQSQSKAKQFTKWTKPGKKLANKGVGVIVRCDKRARKLHWHNRGDYFVTVHPEAGGASVLVHQLSKHTSQAPFRKSKGIIQDAKFHPFKPQLFVASQRYVRVYDLSRQVLLKKLNPGVRWISSIDVHPRGENVLIGSYDKRVIWQDMELGDKPFKVLRYHDRAVRDVEYHSKLPLFCSASDDGHINVLHCTVYEDLLKNPLLVPLKILTGHKVTRSLGVLQVDWHPREAWLFSVGADGTARLWTT